MSRGECPIPIEERDACPVFQREGTCWSDEHHTAFPKGFYQSGVARAFRELPENKVQLPRCEHNELHATTSPPERPSRAFMLQAIAQQLTKDLEALDGEREMGRRPAVGLTEPQLG